MSRRLGVTHPGHLALGIVIKSRSVTLAEHHGRSLVKFVVSRQQLWLILSPRIVEPARYCFAMKQCMGLYTASLLPAFLELLEVSHACSKC